MHIQLRTSILKRWIRDSLVIMGNCYAVLYKRKFVVNEDIEGQVLSEMHRSWKAYWLTYDHRLQGRASLEVFTLLGLSPNDVDLLYTAFWDIDADGSG